MFPTRFPADRGCVHTLGRVLPLFLGLALASGACSLMPGPSSPYSSSDPTSISAAGAGNAALLALGDAARRAGDLHGAAERYRDAHAADAKALAPLLKLGSTFVALHAYTEALDTYREAQHLAPKDPEVAWRISELLLVTDAPQAALDQLKAVLPERLSDPRVYNAMGVAFGLMGQYALAERNFTAGLRIAPDHIGLSDNLGLAQFLAGNYSGAVATLSAVAQRPEAARARQNLAAIYTLHGDVDKARAVARRDLDPATVEANIDYFRTLAAAGRLQPSKQAAAVFGAHFGGDPGVTENARIAARPAAAQTQ